MDWNHTLSVLFLNSRFCWKSVESKTWRWFLVVMSSLSVKVVIYCWNRKTCRIIVEFNRWCGLCSTVSVSLFIISEGHIVIYSRMYSLFYCEEWRLFGLLVVFLVFLPLSPVCHGACLSPWASLKQDFFFFIGLTRLSSVLHKQTSSQIIVVLTTSSSPGCLSSLFHPASLILTLSAHCTVSTHQWKHQSDLLSMCTHPIIWLHETWRNHLHDGMSPLWINRAADNMKLWFYDACSEWAETVNLWFAPKHTNDLYAVTLRSLQNI